MYYTSAGKMILNFVRAFIPVLLLILPDFLPAQDWFNQETISATVLLEKKVGPDFFAKGTGFLLYNYESSDMITLVTCAHILAGSETYMTVEADPFLNELLGKVKNQKIGPWTYHEGTMRIPIDRTKVAFDKDKDIAACRIPTLVEAIFGDNQTKIIKIITVKGIPKSVISRKSEIRLGKDIYFLGFPFAIGTKSGYSLQLSNNVIEKSLDFTSDISNPVLRHGIVSWKSDFESEFLVDAFSYGGNSGSPVFTKGYSSEAPMLVGMVLGHLGESIDNSRTNINEIVVQGNSGLARCIWIDDILQVVDLLNR